jgi:Flp pilus assembly protein TadG
VEAALVLPLMLTLALGVVYIARLADAIAGVDAATAAAAGAAARAPSAADAQSAGQAAFAAALAGYGLKLGAVSIDTGSFDRQGTVTARGHARVDLTFVPVPGAGRPVIAAVASAPIQRWRSR